MSAERPSRLKLFQGACDTFKVEAAREPRCPLVSSVRERAEVTVPSMCVETIQQEVESAIERLSLSPPSEEQASGQDLKEGGEICFLTVVGTDAFHPRVSLDSFDETCQKVAFSCMLWRSSASTKLRQVASCSSRCHGR